MSAFPLRAPSHSQQIQAESTTGWWHHTLMVPTLQAQWEGPQECEDQGEQCKALFTHFGEYFRTGSYFIWQVEIQR